MGCYTWFGRPITNEEFSLMRDYAVKSAEEILSWGEDYGMDKSLVNAVRRSVETGEPQTRLYNRTWWQLGYGATNPALGKDFSVFNKEGKLFVRCDEFDMTARASIGIYTYPHKVIHNKRELRRYIGKRYFNITPSEHLKLSEFWKKYPSGIMYWG